MAQLDATLLKYEQKDSAAAAYLRGDDDPDLVWANDRVDEIQKVARRRRRTVVARARKQERRRARAAEKRQRQQHRELSPAATHEIVHDHSDYCGAGGRGVCV